MTPRTLAEILEVFTRITAEIDSHLPGEVKSDAWRERDRLFRVHGPRLLAACRAGVEMRRRVRHRKECNWSLRASPCTCGLIAATAAWDAVAGGRK